VWKAERQPKMQTEPHRLVFIDETGTNTKMTRARGRCDRGKRLRSKAPFGHWKTQTCVAGLRCGALTAPWVIDAPMDRASFDTSVRTQLVPTLQEGDIVILDNLPAHKSPAAEQAIRARGAWLRSRHSAAATENRQMDSRPRRPVGQQLAGLTIADQSGPDQTRPGLHFFHNFCDVLTDEPNRKKINGAEKQRGEE
jgi:DDE superfamily endonuclease